MYHIHVTRPNSMQTHPSSKSQNSVVVKSLASFID